MLRITCVAAIVLLGTMSWVSKVTADPQGGARSQLAGLELEVYPPDPTTATPITVTMTDEFPTACYETCDLVASWVGPTEYHIDWYVAPEPGMCTPMVTPMSQDVDLGFLEAGDYVVTVRGYIPVLPGEPCEQGIQFDSSFTAVHVSEAPVPTISAWGSCVLALSVLTAATVFIIRRRPAGA